MKRILLFFLVISMLSSCTKSLFSIGMSEQDFLKKNNRTTIVYAVRDATVYKRVTYPFGAPPVTKFFYFIKGKLEAVDEGVRAADLKIEIKKD